MKPLLMAFALVLYWTLPVHSIEYELFVGGRQVVGGDTPFSVTRDGKVRFDPRSRTLTLRDAVIRDTLCGIHNAGIDSLTILVEGTDSILSIGADGLRLDRCTFIRSSGHDGQLYVGISRRDRKDSIANYAALRVGEGSPLYISDCYMRLASDGWAIKGGGLETLSVATAEVAALTRDTLRSCIEGFRQVTLRSVVTDGDETYNTKLKSLCQLNSTKKVQEVLILGCLYVGRYIIDVAHIDTVPQSLTASVTGLKKGRIRYDGRNISLTLDSATVQTSGCPAIRNVTIPDLTINVLGPNSINTIGSDALSLLSSTTIQGVGKAGDRLVVKSSGGGIYQGCRHYNYTLRLNAVTMEVDAATRGIYGDGQHSELAISGSRLKVLSTSSPGTFQAIGSFVGCTLKDDDCQNGTAWRQSTGSFDRNDGTTAREVVVEMPTEYYPVSIMNHSLNNVNCADIAIDGVEGTGSLSFNAATKTLMLNDIAIRQVPSTGYYYASGAVYLSEPGYTIRVSGSNSIVHESGIVARYGGTLTGSGTLSIEATDGSAIFTGSEEMFTVACGVLNAKGAEYGFNAAARGGLTLEAANGQTATTHTFSGRSGNIRTKGLTLTDMNISSPVCCYFDTNTNSIMQNGRRTVGGEVTFSQVTRRYGIKVMGVEIDNCNATGIGSPYLYRTDFMTFDESTKTLTLNDFDILSEDMSMNVIDVTGDGLRLAANGYFRINAEAGAAIKVGGANGQGKSSLTFCGDGTFNVVGKYFAVLVGANGSVAFADNVVFKGEGGISGNNLGAKGETLTVKDNAYVECCGMFGSPAVEQFASISIAGAGQKVLVPNWGSVKRFSNGYGVANKAGDAETGQVVLGKPQGRGLYIGETLVTNGNENDVDGTGHISYYPGSKRLMLTGANITNTHGLNGYGIDNQGVEGLTVIVEGDNTITAKAAGIMSEGDISIYGSGTLNVTSEEYEAVALYGADCTISGPTVNLKGKTYALHGDNHMETLTISNTNTRLTMSTEGRATLSRLKKIDLAQGLYITTPFDATFDENYGGITVGGRLYNGIVEISNKEPSAINDITCDEQPAEIYDHAGRRLDRMHKGLNIIKRGNARKKEIRLR